MSFQRVLIALDLSPISAHAMDVGAGLAKALGAQIGLVHVVDPKLAGAPEGAFFGSTAEAVLRHSQIPVLAVRGASR